MKVYDDKHIKNVALVGASKSGKTTLAEAMLFKAGLLNRRGTVEEKNTVSDYHDIEHERNSRSMPQHCILNGKITRLILLTLRVWMIS